jgi:ankyrin repeat protein
LLTVISAKDDDRETHVYRVCQHDHMKIALDLIDRGADISVQNEWGETPLYCACQHGQMEIALASIGRGAYISAKKMSGDKRRCTTLA